MADIVVRAAREVEDLHAFFVAWFRRVGEAPEIGRLEAALADDFRMITPDGDLQGRADVIGRVRAARGGLPADFRIEIRETRPVWRASGAVLLEFVEEQYREGRITRRRSSALFTDAPAAPNGLVWRHLHETWTEAG